MKKFAAGLLVLVAGWGNAQSLPDAVNFPGPELVPSGNSTWFVQDVETMDGVSALQSGAIGNGQRSTIEGSVEGPGTLIFYWKVESEGPDYFRFRVDDVEVARISGNQPWSRYEVELVESRTYNVSWSYEKDGSVASYRDAAWLDSISLGNFELSASRQKISHEAQSFTVEVTGSGSWATAAPADWITISPDHGTGPGSVTITATLNESVWRRADLTIAGFPFVVDQEAVLSSGDAINNNVVELTPVQNGLPMWFTQTEESHDWVDALQAGRISHGQSTAVQGEVHGPGTLSFWWLVESEGPDYLHFKIDGEVQHSISGVNRAWQLMSYELSESRPYQLEWVYSKDVSVNSGRDTAWLDEVSFGSFQISDAWSKQSFEAHSYTIEVTGEGAWSATENREWASISPSHGTGPGTVTVTLDENTDRWRRADIYIGGNHHVLDQETELTSANAINNSRVRLTPVLNGLPMWFTQTEETHDGVDALQAGHVGHGQSTAIQAQVEGPGTLSFWWKVESEGPDYLRFVIDGEVQHSISGTTHPWQLMTYELSESREYTLEWIYSKDGSINAGRDTAWLDEVSFGTFNVQPTSIKAPWHANVQSIQVNGTGNWSVKEVSDFAVMNMDSGWNNDQVLVDLPLNEGDWRYTQLSVAGQVIMLDQEGELTTNSAVDNNAIRLFPVPGTLAWFTEAEGGIGNGSVIRSGRIGHGGMTAMQAWVHGPGEFSFYWRTDSEGPDPLIFTLDDIEISRISGSNRDWTPLTVQLEESRLYNVKWTYAKDGSIIVGADAGYVDFIMTPNAHLDWATRYFNPEQLQDPLISGPDADPDRDGVPNRIERELNLSPLNSASTVTLSIGNPVAGVSVVTLFPMTQSVPFHLETTTDWLDWVPVSESLFNFENGTATLSWDDFSADTQFFRIVWD